MAMCQVCQHDNPAGAEYCEDCGAALTTSAPMPVGAGVSGGGAQAANGSTSAPASPASGPSIGASASPPGASTSNRPPAPPAADVVPTPASSPAPSPLPSVPGTTDQMTAPATGTSVPAPAATPDVAAADAASAPPATPSAGATAQARIVAVRYGAPSGEEIPLLGQRLIVGRFDPETGPVDVDLSALDTGGHVSRQHGELYREPNNSWMVRDLGSTNGIFVKGSDATSFGPRITAPRALADGDELAFGNARFIFKTT